MTDFVLVPGAWLGSWVWDPVADDLRARGHRVYPVTLPGLGCGDKTDVGLSDHVHHILKLLETEDLHEAVIVGHSYAGIVVGVAAGQALDRIAKVIFLDANLPIDGAAMIDAWSGNGQRIVRAEISASGGVWPVPDPDDLLEHDLSKADAERLTSEMCPHPGQTLLEPAHLTRPLTELTAAYIVCTHPDPAPRKELEPFRDHWTFIDLNTGHWPMVSAPDSLAELLHRL